MSRTISFMQIGLGPIGRQVVSFACERPGVVPVDAVDTDPSKLGQDLGVLLKRDPMDVVVTADAAAALSKSSADVVIITTTSKLTSVEESILLSLENGKNVISTTEELAYPWKTNPELSRRIDTAARKNGVTVLATGVNPGFAMDTLPLVLSGACRQIDSIFVQRHQDASIRRLPFQKKIGAGLSIEEFNARAASGSIRHVGFTESMQMIAAKLGWDLDCIDDRVLPVIAAEGRQVAGIRQLATGYRDGRAVIEFELEAYLGHPAPKDSVRIEGDPSIYSEVRGGINGDTATSAMIVNALPQVLAAAPGLKTMSEIAAVSWFESL